MLKKVVLGIVGATLVVAIVVGAVVGVSRSHNNANVSENVAAASGDSSLLTTTNKIESFCAPTTYKDTCEQTLKNAFSGSASAKDVVHVTVQAITEAVKAAFVLTQNVGKNAADSMDQQAFDICKKLLQDSADELEAVIGEAKDLQGILSKSDDILTWLSAVISYQETCLDAIQQAELKEQMSNGLSNTTQLTSNALAIVGQLSSVSKVLAGGLNLGGLKLDGSRRLLESDADVEDVSASEVDFEAIPSWLVKNDRKLLEGGARPRPNVVVAQDGSGNFRTINDAIKSIPNSYNGRYVIYVKAGTYRENVLIDNKKPSILMYGDGPRKTIVTGHKNFVDGTQTFATATFAVESDGFIAMSMGFSNTAGAAKHQAVALRVKGDKAAFFRCRMDAFQDTLYAQAKRQFYRNCVISGTIDFIFGDSAMIIQNCLLIVRRPMDNQQNIVTASGRKDPHTTTGIVIQNCKIVPDQALFPDRLRFRTYLGRPWKVYARTIVMESVIGDLIQPDGWMPWEGTQGLKTLYYAEYANKGPGAGTSKRVNWPGYHVINKATAQQFTVTNFIQGQTWLREAGVPYIAGFRY